MSNLRKRRGHGKIDRSNDTFSNILDVKMYKEQGPYFVVDVTVPETRRGPIEIGGDLIENPCRVLTVYRGTSNDRQRSLYNQYWHMMARQRKAATVEAYAAR